MKYFLYSLIFLSFFSCSTKRNTQAVKNYSQITYAFRDASVPPPYHRSYTIDVNPSESKVVVNSYGEVLAESTEKISAATWENLVALAGELQSAGSFTADGATGTKGYSLRLYVDGEQVYELYWDSLSTDKAEKSALDLRSALKATIHNLSELTR